jgi:hypothetical protein
VAANIINHRMADRCAGTSPNFHPARPRKFAATSATIAGCQWGQGPGRFGSSESVPQRGQNMPVSWFRNVNSSASVPQRRTPCHCWNVAALRMLRQFRGAARRGEPYFARGDAAAPFLSKVKIISLDVLIRMHQLCYRTGVGQAMSVAEVPHRQERPRRAGAVGDPHQMASASSAPKSCRKAGNPQARMLPSEH